ncbi:MAG: Modification methylase DpnIIB [Syntrophomonadaceae bacterium]|nr:Modification methylase DpnIIB [Bacillota bacterium]
MNSTERFEKVHIDRLVLYAKNPRVHSRQQVLQLRSSLREFGFINPVLVDKDLNIIAGHGRIMAAREEGWTEIPCIFVEHLTDAQKRAYTIADNRLALSAGWDEELLALEFADLKELNFDIGLTGFDADEIEKLFAASAEAKEDNFDVDAQLKKSIVSKPGDLWTLGRHRLVVGDSTKPETYTTLMQGVQANLILTDPPYGVNYTGGRNKIRDKIKNDSFKSDELFYKFLFDAFKNMSNSLANNGVVYVFYADIKGLLVYQAFQNVGFKVVSCCIWVKNRATFERSDYHWRHELCLYGWKQSGKHNWYGDRRQTTVWEYDNPSRSESHPTMKPIPLLATPIQNSTQPGDVVLDPFGGSGSTLICCEQLNRTCYMIELDPKFADVIVNRYIETAGNFDNVSVERSNQQIAYAVAGGA